MCTYIILIMNKLLLFKILCFTILLITVTNTNSIPITSSSVIHRQHRQQQHSLQNDNDIKITNLNRDDCLAKLLCGMSVDSIQNKKSEQFYGEYAHIIGNFFNNNPSGEDDLSQESLEALEDYSVSTEDEEQQQQQHGFEKVPPPPSMKIKYPGSFKPINHQESTTTTQNTMSESSTQTTIKPIRMQILDLGKLVKQTSNNQSGSNGQLYTSQDNLNPRLGRARKILKNSNLIDTKLMNVRECQKISGCSYTFKQLYQKYGGGHSNGQRVSHENIGRPIQILEEYKRPEPPKNWFQSEKKVDSIAADEEFDYFSTEEKNNKFPELDGFFQSSNSQQSNEFFNNPGTTYKKKQINKLNYKPNFPPKRKMASGSSPPAKRKASISNTGTMVRIRTSTTTMKPRVRSTTKRPTNYKHTNINNNNNKKKKIINKKKNNNNQGDDGDDDDDNDDINKKYPVKLIGNPGIDSDQISNESLRDEYDEEAKYETPVDYGNDEDGDDDDDDDDDEGDEDKRILKLPKFKSKSKSEGKTKNDKDNKDDDDDDDKTNKSKSNSTPAILQTELKKENEKENKKPIDKIPSPPPAFPSKEVFNLLNDEKNSKSKEKKSSEENRGGGGDDNDDDDDDDDFYKNGPYEQSPYITQIGGRPISPDYQDIPISMTFGSSIPQKSYLYPPNQNRNSMMKPRRPPHHITSYQTHDHQKEPSNKNTGYDKQQQQQQQQQQPQQPQPQQPQEQHQQTQPQAQSTLSAGIQALSPITNMIKNSFADIRAKQGLGIFSNLGFGPQSPPMPHDGQSPPIHHNGQSPPIHHNGQSPPIHHNGQSPPIHHNGQSPPTYHNGQYPPIHHNGQSPPTRHNGQQFQHQAPKFQGGGGLGLYGQRQQIVHQSQNLIRPYHGNIGRSPFGILPRIPIGPESSSYNREKKKT